MANKLHGRIMNFLSLSLAQTLVKVKLKTLSQVIFTLLDIIFTPEPEAEHLGTHTYIWLFAQHKYTGTHNEF